MHEEEKAPLQHNIKYIYTKKIKLSFTDNFFRTPLLAFIYIYIDEDLTISHVIAHYP